jgi:hypothetical protein
MSDTCPRPEPQSRWSAHLVAVACLALSLTFAVVVLVLFVPGKPDDPAPVAATAPTGEIFSGGWVNDPEACDAVRASLPVGERYFGDTPAGKATKGEDKDVLLSDAAKQLLGKHIPTRNQLDVGSCVSFGVVGAVEHLLCVQALEQGAGPDAFRELVQEATYALSRVEIGGGRIRGDGSVTAWAAESGRRYGFIPRGIHGRYDLTKYDTKRCREWGRLGLPDELEPVARQSPVKGITFVRSADEAAKAIRQGYPIAQGSRIGFGNVGPHRRDADGFLRRSSTWSHTMATIGVIGGKRPGFLILNSWGEDWISGSTGGRDIPPGSFFVDYATFNEMCREGDAVAFSDAVGFPARDPWFLVQKPQANAADVALEVSR